MFSVEQFTNHPIDSITYIISNPIINKAIIIDPGTENDERIVDFLKTKQLEPKYIFLTHEHFDHILGVNYLRENFPNIQLVSSSKTSERLGNPKKNLAIFHNQIKLMVNEADIIVEEEQFKAIDLSFDVFQTPGHTDSSISFKINQSFFSGDFLLQGTRVVTNLPTGSKKEYLESIEKHKTMLEGLKIYPGHGDSYIFHN